MGVHCIANNIDWNTGFSYTLCRDDGGDITVRRKTVARDQCLGVMHFSPLSALCNASQGAAGAPTSNSHIEVVPRGMGEGPVAHMRNHGDPRHIHPTHRTSAKDATAFPLRPHTS